MPPGPTEFWIAQRVLSSQKNRLNFFITGVICCDLLYAAIAFWGYYGVLEKSGLSLMFSAVGSASLMLLGLYDFWKFRSPPKLAPVKLENIRQETALEDFVSGFFLCGFNFMFILFWIFFATSISSVGLKMQGVGHHAALLVGIAAGDWIWYKVFGWFVHQSKSRLSPHWFHRIQQGLSLCLCIFGALALYEIFNP